MIRIAKLSRQALLILGLCSGLLRLQAADLYVSTQGSDANAGTSSQPFRTITKAYSIASAGSTIIVMPGTYTDYTSGWGIRLGKSGTASSPIVLKSQTRGGAIIDGQNASDRNVCFYVDGSYNVVDGFEIRNGPNGGIKVWGNSNRFINNEIHHNGNPASTSTNGKDGIYSSQGTSGNYYACNSIHDNGRVGSKLDHGLYLCGQNETIVNNLLFRNTGSGLQIAGYTTVRNMKVYNNVMAYNGTSGIILWMALSGIDIKNNLLINNTSYGVTSYDGHGSGVVLDCNLVRGNGAGNYNFTLGGSDYTYTLGTTIISDPLLVNAASTGFDPHLKAGSPAIGAGLNLSSVFTIDRDGAARPASGTWDLGPYVSGSLNNTAPTISSIVNQTITAGTSTGPLAFAVVDAQTAATSLTVSGSSSNPTLVPNTSIALGGSGSSRTVTVTPATGQIGTATITLTVSDGVATARTSFVLTVNAAANPVVTLTAPAAGTTYVAPATINLSASVVANGYTIGKVQFYNGATLIGEDASAPYAYTWSGVAPGAWSLSARAVCTSGTFSSPAVSVTVNPATSLGSTFASTAGTITAPFSVSGSVLVQSTYTSVTTGGRAAYSFSVPTAGDYVVSALVNAPTADANSFFVNIDAEPTDPVMIWDIPLTSGLLSRTVSWRGTGTVDASQYVPKVFSLTAGTHQLIVRGREPNCQLGTITITPANPVGTPVVVLTAPASGSTFAAPATLNLAATVTLNGQTITKVQFFNGSTLVNEDTAAPYGFTLSNVAAGTYALKAVAVYGAGATASSAIVNVAVTAPSSSVTMAATSGTISSPFTASNGGISQSSYTSVSTGGRAVYSFSVAAKGDYLVSAMVTAPTADANSFFVNIDAEPTDPVMIWDIPVAAGPVSRTVSWRGTGTVDASQFTPKLFNLAAGTHQLIIRGREANCVLGTITVTPLATTLAAPWQVADVGAVSATSVAVAASSTPSVANAANLGGTADSFRFVYQSLSGDGEIKARIVDPNASNGCAGVMIRENLTRGAKYASVGLSPEGKCRWQVRNSTSGATVTVDTSTGTAPAWVKLVRSGNELNGYLSADGVTWQNVASATNVMAPNICVGLVVSSGDTAPSGSGADLKRVSVVP
jgi:hypothetical protein